MIDIKKICSILCLLFLLSSCSKVKTEVPVQILAETVGKEIVGYENLTSASADYIRYCMQSDLSLYEEYVILYPFSGTRYNEFGIFKLKNNNDRAAAKAELEKYLAFKKENWDTRYNANEFSKIQSAKIFACEKYLLYTILSPEEANSVSKAFLQEVK